MHYSYFGNFLPDVIIFSLRKRADRVWSSPVYSHKPDYPRCTTSNQTPNREFTFSYTTRHALITDTDAMMNLNLS